MKYNQLSAFEKHLAQAKPNHLSTLYGILAKDPGERLLIYNSIKATLQTQFPALTIKSYSAEHPKGENGFLQDLESHSLLSADQLIHLTACESCSKEFPARLQKALKSVALHTFVVVSGESLTKNSTLYKTLEKLGVICELGESKLWEKEKAIADWIATKAAENEKKIDTNAVNMLARGVGANLSNAASEWEKLLGYVGDRKKIEAHDVHAICALSITDSTWQLPESIMAGQSKEALEVGFRALSQGQSIIALLRQIRHQALIALEAASFEKQGSLENLIAKYPYLKGALLDKHLKVARLWGEEKLATAIQKIDAAEFKAKDGVQDGELILTTLIAELS